MCVKKFKTDRPSKVMICGSPTDLHSLWRRSMSTTRNCVQRWR